jgi:serine/threonine protein kinase
MYRCPVCTEEGELGDPCPRHPERHFIPPTQTRDRELGRRFGPYVVVDKVGGGGFGKVMLALEFSGAMKGRRVALKLDKQTSPAFDREIRLLKKLRSNHIVPILAAGHDDGRDWIATAFLEGRPLEELLHEVALRGEALNPLRAHDILRQICIGLAEAHGAGITHRDLKPANIMIKEGPGGTYDQVSLIDFGIGSDLNELDTEVAAGSPKYMAPEQALGQSASQPADVYAVGLIAGELLSGQRLYANVGKFDIYAAKRSPDFQPLAELTSLPLAYRAALDRAVRFNPEERPTIFELLEELSAAPGGAHAASANAEPRAETGPISQPPAVAAPPALPLVESRAVPTELPAPASDLAPVPQLVRVRPLESRRRGAAWVVGGIVVLLCIGLGLAWWESRAPGRPDSGLLPDAAPPSVAMPWDGGARDVGPRDAVARDGRPAVEIVDARTVADAQRAPLEVPATVGTSDERKPRGAGRKPPRQPKPEHPPAIESDVPPSESPASEAPRTEAPESRLPQAEPGNAAKRALDGFEKE